MKNMNRNLRTLRKINFILSVMCIISMLGFITLTVKGGYITKLIEDVERSRSYNVLCIGNSITIHPKCDYWWGEWGMSASTKENDYVHVLEKLLTEDKGKKVNMCAYNFSAWELSSMDRAEFLPFLDNYLYEKLDLVIIQLGENVKDASTLEADYLELIDYISSYDVQIVVVGNFWENQQVDECKRAACSKKIIKFVSLNDIQSGEYTLEVGDKVYGDDGKQHEVEHSGVAAHPNDKTMEYIAKAIEQVIE